MQPYDGASKEQLREAFAAHGLRPNKKLGQNFLCDKNTADAIVRAAGDLTDLLAVEIGPGAGALTVRLAQTAKRVHALELDAGLYRLLCEKMKDMPHVTIFHGDALKFDFAVLGDMPCVVVANLPYYVTTAILMRLLHEMPNAQTMVLMMQKEVAQRLTALPGGKDYGSLSLSVQYYAEVKKVLQVPPACFYPAPEVDSAVVRLDRRPPVVEPRDPDWMFEIIRVCFAMRRKTVWNNLSALLGRENARKALAACNIDPQARGETLTIQQYAALSDAALPFQS